MNISIDCRYCNRFYSPRKTDIICEPQRRLAVFRIPTRLGILVLDSRAAGHSICDPCRIITTRCSCCSVNPILVRSAINIAISSPTCLYKPNCNGFNHHERHIIYLIDHQQQSATFLWSRNDMRIPRAPENMSHTYSSQFNSPFGRNINLSSE